jgi:hypothetical protein
VGGKLEDVENEELELHARGLGLVALLVNARDALLRDMVRQRVLRASPDVNEYNKNIVIRFAHVFAV